MVPNQHLPSNLGEIPNSWKRVRFSDVMKVRQGLQIAISDRLMQQTDTSKEYITIQSIKKTEQAREYVESPSNRVICGKEDVLMTRTGNTGIVVTGVEGVFHNNFFLMDFDRNQIDKQFLVYYLHTTRVQHLILTKAGASTIPDLNHKDFYSIEFPLAPLLEQQKIAKILSTWDKAISTTETLIDNSKQLKKALMQQLLTGKKRFAGFEVECKDIPLGYLTKIYDGTHNTPTYVDSGIPFYSVEHLTRDDFTRTKFITIEVYEKENKRVKLETNDILMTRIGDIGTAKCLNWDVKASFYVSLALIKGNQAFDSVYLTYYINSQQFQNELWQRTIHVAFPKKINLGEISNCLIKLPSIEEQQKIASVLTNADKEIELLKNQLADLKQEKKALMQQLLTGKRRVKVDESEVEITASKLKHSLNAAENLSTDYAASSNHARELETCRKK